MAEGGVERALRLQDERDGAVEHDLRAGRAGAGQLEGAAAGLEAPEEPREEVEARVVHDEVAVVLRREGGGRELVGADVVAAQRGAGGVERDEGGVRGARERLREGVDLLVGLGVGVEQGALQVDREVDPLERGLHLGQKLLGDLLLDLLAGGAVDAVEALLAHEGDLLGAAVGVEEGLGDLALGLDE